MLVLLSLAAFCVLVRQSCCFVQSCLTEMATTPSVMPAQAGIHDFVALLIWP